jgi:probable DNA metabolism protein
MTTVVYDGSWLGFLTAVFEVYEYRLADTVICGEMFAPANLFGETHKVFTDESKAIRVWERLKQKLTPGAYRQLYDSFLSEDKGMEDVLLRYVRYSLAAKVAVENDFSHPDILLVKQVSRKVHREKHRMEAFVRFQLTKDQLYYAIVQPDHNVLPLIAKHFKARYADQRWLIYDATRKYGIYYDLEKVEEVQLNFSADLQNDAALTEVYDENESLYQQLWQQYFKSVNIAARKNTKLHIRHMPKRYWKYLVEKK